MRDLVLLFTQLVHFSLRHNLVLTELDTQSVLFLRLREPLALSGCVGLQLVHVCTYGCLPGAQTDLVEFEIVATVAPHKMWDRSENWFCPKWEGLCSPG